MSLSNLHIRIILMLAMGAVFLPAAAQIPIKVSAVRQVRPDSADVAFGTRRHFWRAAGEVFGFNIGLWAFDRYVQNGDYARISWNSIKENFRHGFIWDNDKLGTNTFLHPNNGSLYFNAGRANGFNYWQSSLFAIAGSGMWELFMECEYPSTNDFIATPIGGTAIGEVLFRASDAVIDERTRGARRFGHELACFLISPMRGLNRIITGEAWRYRPTRGRLYGIPNFAIRASVGMRTLVPRGKLNQTHVGAVAQLDMEYGDRFEVKSTKPYDYFTIRAQIQGMKSQPVLSQLEIKGRLLAREILESRKSSMSIGLYQHFDYYDSDTIDGIEKVPYKLGIPACIGAGLMFRDSDTKRCVLDFYTHVNGVILGSILSDHYETDERNYNFASGFSIKAGANLVIDKDKFSISVNHEFYRLFTWSGYRYGTDLSKVDYRTLNVQGDKSAASFNVTEVRADYRIWKKLYASLSFTNYMRTTHYRDYPDVRSSSFDLNLMLAYKF